MIGTFGNLVFIASADQIRTFEGFTRNTAPRWSEHEIIGKYPKPEYIGPGLDTISFSMRFDVRYGMNPRQEMTRLLVMCRDGQAETLIVGGMAMGVSKWTIRSVSQSWTRLDGKGNVLVGGANVSLKEYI